MENVIKFTDPRVVALWNCEISGQLSDGFFENSNRHNRKLWVNAVLSEKVEPVDIKGYMYNLNRLRLALIKYELDCRMTAYINASNYYIASNYDYNVGILAENVFDIVYNGVKNGQTYDDSVKNALDFLSNAENLKSIGIETHNLNLDFVEFIKIVAPQEDMNLKNRKIKIKEVFDLTISQINQMMNA